MNKLEVTKLVTVLSVNYRNFIQVGQEEYLINLWHEMLSDTPYEVAVMAVKKFMSESTYPPTIADIRKNISAISNPTLIDPMDCWGEVKKAIRHYGMYRVQEAMNSFDPLTKKAVEAIGFKELCLSDNEMADRAHFIKTIERYQDRQKQEYLLSPELILAIEKSKAIKSIE